MQQEPLIIKTSEIDARALRIVAKSVYKELKLAGYKQNDIVTFASTLLEFLTEELREKSS